MRLRDLINLLSCLDDNATIYARRPWTPDSEALVEMEPETGALPESAARLGLEYFLEVVIARDVISDADAATPLKTQCERLIAYALNDA